MTAQHDQAAPFQLFEALDADTYNALKASIRERGVQIPIVLDEDGTIIDGHHRHRAWTELRAEGVSVAPFPSMTLIGLDDDEKRRRVIELNLYRRHLTPETRARMIQGSRSGGMTLQAIADAAGVSKSQVHRDLGDAEATFPSGKVAGAIGKDGKVRPTRYTPRATPIVFATTQRQRLALLDAAAAGVLGELPASIVPADHKIIRDGAKQLRRLREDARVALLPPAVLVRPDVRLEVADGRHMPLPGPDGAIVDLTVVSPWYGVDLDYDLGDIDPSLWEPFVTELAQDLLRVTKPSGRLALNVPFDSPKGGRRSVAHQALNAVAAAVEQTPSGEVRWEYQFMIDWHEGNTTKGGIPLGSQRSSDRPYHVCQGEPVFVFSKGAWAPSSEAPSDIGDDEWRELSYSPWTFSGESRPWGGHPGTFPLEAPRRLIRYLSRPGDTVLDACVGSGTTVLAALQLGRQAIGFDISAQSIESAKRRIVAWDEEMQTVMQGVAP